MVSNSDVKIPVSRPDISSYTLKNWQLVFKKIYSTINEGIRNESFNGNKVAFSKGHIISNITRDLGDLGEQIREVDAEGCVKYIGSMFAWICALCTEWDLDLEEILWNKFPGYCPYCCQGKDCAEGWWTIDQ